MKPIPYHQQGRYPELGTDGSNARINASPRRQRLLLFPMPITAFQIMLFFVGIDTGTNGGDVYKISSAQSPAASTPKDLKIGSGSGLNAVRCRQVWQSAAIQYLPGVREMPGFILVMTAGPAGSKITNRLPAKPIPVC